MSNPNQGNYSDDIIIGHGISQEEITQAEIDKAWEEFEAAQAEQEAREDDTTKEQLEIYYASLVSSEDVSWNWYPEDDEG